MSILSFPPELVLEIFSLAITDFPSSMPSIYLTRQRNLRSFALVHRCWTPIAQEMMREEVWVKISQNSKKARKQKTHKLGQYPRKQFRTKYLRIDGDYEIVWYLLHQKGLQDVVTLRHSCERRSMCHQISFYAGFRSLESLQIDSGRFLMEPCSPGSTFCNLKRLSLGQLYISDYLTTDENLFTPASFPCLEHLAVVHLDSRFTELFPQLTTLSICGSFDWLKPFLQQRSQFSKIKHLSFVLSDDIDEGIPRLFQPSGDTYLESVHMPVKLIGYSQKLGSILIGIAKEQRERKQNARIILYGDKLTLQSYLGASIDLSLFSLREKQLYPPFEDFDGK